MSLAYARHLAENGESAVTPEEFTRVRCGVDPYTGEPTQGALQSEEPKTDVNRIIQEYDRDGYFKHLNGKVAHFMDVSEVPDYRTAIHQIREAENFFNGLPAKVRAAFSNETAEFLDALQDPSKRELLEELEIVPKQKGTGAAPTPAPVPAPVTPAPTQ